MTKLFEVSICVKFNGIGAVTIYFSVMGMGVGFAAFGYFTENDRSIVCVLWIARVKTNAYA